jgi:zinc protease
MSVARDELQGEAELTPAAISAVAARYLEPGNSVVVVAGDSRQWIDALREKFPGLRVVNSDGVAVN